MLIQTETTPNPATLKFMPGRKVMDAGTRDLLTRKRPALADLQAAAPGVGEFLAAFLAARLVVTDEEGGHPVITLAHEALITHLLGFGEPSFCKQQLLRVS